MPALEINREDSIHPKIHAEQIDVGNRQAIRIQANILRFIGLVPLLMCLFISFGYSFYICVWVGYGHNDASVAKLIRTEQK